MFVSFLSSSNASSESMIRLATSRYVMRGSIAAAFLPALLIIAGVLSLAISAHIKVPFYPIPQTMQTLVVLLIGISYGSVLAGTTLFSYLLAGYLGAPVFANGAGFLYMMGPTGGYLAGFFVAAVVMGALADRGWTRNWQSTILAMVIGNGVIYLFGLAWLGYLFGIEVAIKTGFLPFIYGDLLKLILAALGVPVLWKWVQAIQDKL